jgi:hypothetical protein
VCILAFVNYGWKPRLVRMQRPWCTMFCSIALLAVMLIFGVLYSQHLPPGITARVSIVKFLDRPLVFSARLTAASLRGAIIEWHDGLFESWKQTYFGVWA